MSPTGVAVLLSRVALLATGLSLAPVAARAAERKEPAARRAPNAKVDLKTGKAPPKEGKSKPKSPAGVSSKSPAGISSKSPAAKPAERREAPKPEVKAHPVQAKSLPRVVPNLRAYEPALKPPGEVRTPVRAVRSQLVTPAREVAERTLAFHYANLTDDEALAEVSRRGIAWVSATPPLPGVRAPIRLTGPLRGVTIHSTLPPEQRKTSAFEILDARLALALDDFCVLLARHDVVELVHYTMYRPPAELPPNLYQQIRHPAGLAIDVGAVRKRDGRWLAIGPHWPSAIGAKTCGEGAREHWSRPARELVSIACEAADLGMFHFVLTPHFDAAHADHLHLEIKPNTRWFLVN